MTPEQVALWWQSATNSDRKDFLRRIGAQERDAEKWVIYFANVRQEYSPEAAAREARTCIPDSKVKDEQKKDNEPKRG